MEGSRFKTWLEQNMEGVLVVMGSARTLSEHCRCTLEQGTEPQNTHIGTWNELVTLMRLLEAQAPFLCLVKGQSSPVKKKNNLYCLHALII